jgi:hypothetical protein
MTEEISYCDSCRASILEKEFETGSAVTLLGKRYCSRCKGAAIKKVSLEEATEGKPSPKRPSPGKPASRPPEPRSHPHARKESSSRRPPSKTPLILAAAAGGAVLLIAVLVLTLRPASKPPAPEPAPLPSPPPAQSREQAARQAFSAVERLATGSTSPDAVLKAAEAARPACAGTPWEGRLEEIRAKALKRKEDSAGEQELARILQEIKEAIARDPEYAQYEAIMAKAQQARGLAARVAPTTVPEIQKTIAPYSEKYEKMAEPFYAPIVEEANGLTQERRYEDALKKIETFPRNLRQSQAWKNLEGLKRQIELRRKDDPSRKK